VTAFSLLSTDIRHILPV